MEQNVKGTRDLLPLEAANIDAIVSLLKQIATLFSYHEVQPPVIEHSSLFIRGVGESSDIVRKEMYTFDDKGNRSLTLRPEFTAGIMRLIAQNKTYVDAELPLKYFYFGPVFRYERPQLGRYRQFLQFGAESVGNNSYLNDVEVIVMVYTMFSSLGLDGMKIKINSLGDDASRDAYKQALKEYLSKYIDNMCPDCKERFNLNPLRILDCKVPEDQEIVKGAPKMSDYLSNESQTRFDNVLSTLKELGIPVEIDDNLVRGLDYYSETVFEIHYISDKGNNYGAISAGGHYDKLVKEVGGPDMPGVGFSFGVDRLFLLLQDGDILPIKEQGIDIYVMPMGEAAGRFGLNIANILRLNGYTTDICFDSCKMGAMFKRAEKKKAKFAVIIGDNEINENVVMIKNLDTQEQEKIPFDNLVNYFDAIFNEEHCDCGCEDNYCDDGDDCCCHENHDHEHCCCGGHHDHGHCCCEENENKKEGK